MSLSRCRKHRFDDPVAKIKVLVAETLRGVGDLVFVAHGNRFANELGRRNSVTGEMWKDKLPCSLTLNTGRGVMKLCESGGAFAADMGVPVSKMEESIEASIQTSLKIAQDPDGAVPSVS